MNDEAQKAWNYDIWLDCIEFIGNAEKESKDRRKTLASQLVCPNQVIPLASRYRKASEQPNIYLA
jgi:hypothetical protein